MQKFKLVLSSIFIILFALVAIEPIGFTRNESRGAMKTGLEVIGSSYNDQAHDITGPDQYNGTAIYVSNTKPNNTNTVGVRHWTYPTEGSVSMWVKTDNWNIAGGGTSDGQQHRVTLANNLIFWTYFTSAGVLAFNLKNTGTELLTVGNFYLPSNTWFHVSFCWNSSVTQVIFTNGAVAGIRIPGALTHIGATNNLTYGHYLEGGNGWKGWIDNVKVYEECIVDWSEEVALFERTTLNDL